MTPEEKLKDCLFRGAFASHSVRGTRGPCNVLLRDIDLHRIIAACHFALHYSKEGDQTFAHLAMALAEITEKDFYKHQDGEMRQYLLKQEQPDPVHITSPASTWMRD